MSVHESVHACVHAVRVSTHGIARESQIGLDGFMFSPEYCHSKNVCVCVCLFRQALESGQL